MCVTVVREPTLDLTVPVITVCQKYDYASAKTVPSQLLLYYYLRGAECDNCSENFNETPAFAKIQTDNDI